MSRTISYLERMAIAIALAVPIEVKTDTVTVHAVFIHKIRSELDRRGIPWRTSANKVKRATRKRAIQRARNQGDSNG
jgi:hypothetical protein